MKNVTLHTKTIQDTIQAALNYSLKNKMKPSTHLKLEEP